MATVGLLFRLETSWGKEDEAARFLEHGLTTVLEDVPVTAWFAVRFGPTSFGVFHAFPDEAGQQNHVGDRIAAALREHGAGLFVQTPAVDGFDVLSMELATKVPS
jgi:hypothetical protein